MSGYALRPAVPARGAAVYVPGVGGRTGMVGSWSVPGGRPVAAAVWKRPAEPGSVAGRGRELVVALRDQGLREVVLVGHSMGALIAFEASILAPELVSSLVLAAQYPPHRMRRYSRRELEELSVLDRMAASLPAELAESAEFLALIRDTWKKEYRMVEEYIVGERTPVPIRVFGADNDVSSSDIALLREWALHATGEVAAWIVPGEHDFIESCSASEFRNLLPENRS